MNPVFLTDGYKLLHHQMYPEGTSLVFSNFTPRRNSYGPAGIDGVLVVGTGYAVQYLHDMFYKEFFQKPKKEVIAQIKEEFSMYTGLPYDTTHFEDLHDLRFLPIIVRSLDEGTVCPFGVPILTINNTLPQFYWLPNFLETIISNLLWKPVTAATYALEYRKILEKWANKTSPEAIGFVDFQAHDFSMRGLSGVSAAEQVGIGHNSVFSGSDNIPSILACRKYYDAEGFVVGGVPATEHSVMSMGTKEAEQATFQRLLETYPKGILSVVSDTWNLWEVVTTFATNLKSLILSRDGKLVIRPDSGDPVKILCGDVNYTNPSDPYEKCIQKGVIELLWDVFGGHVNSSGYKVLDSHIGAIYGDSITLERAEKICQLLADKGFASTNVVLGVGSYTYQYNTRDTFGMAMKATFGVVKGEPREIFKDPITDDGLKKSAKGLLQVEKENGVYVLKEVPFTDEDTIKDARFDSELKPIFMDSVIFNIPNFSTIRDRVKQLTK